MATARRRVWVPIARRRPSWFLLRFEELTAERARSLAQAVASVQAEGLTIGIDAAAITDRWARGEISTAQMRELVRRLYGAP
jgi:hypothetical protein